MIQLISNEHGDSCPAIVCRTCTREIHGANAGNVLWSDVAAPFAVHKGACDQQADPGRDLHSMELETFVDDLRHNVHRPIEER